LISAAVKPLRPSSPKRLLTLAICGCLGIIAGFGIGIVRDLWDRVFRTTDQAERLLQVPCVAIVPNLRQLPAKSLQSAEKPTTVGGDLGAEMPSPTNVVTGLDENSKVNVEKMGDAFDPDQGKKRGPRTLVRDGNVLWTSVDLPFSPFAEALRSIKLAIDLGESGKRAKVIGFTSALPDEGKSTIAAALALLIAQAGCRVILVDCDLRNPSLTRALAPSAKAGIVELLRGNASIEDVLWWSDTKTNLAFLPAVVKSRLAHTNELLASAETKNLFDELRQRYEYVIVDLSPLAPIVDTRTAAHFVSAFVCVIEWGKTKIDVVKRALGDAPNVQQKILGTVLNKAEFHKLSDYEAHLGKYYNNKHYSRYGYVGESHKPVLGFIKRMWQDRRPDASS
jgi:polysaccharide biosynthesis transport protein